MIWDFYPGCRICIFFLSRCQESKKLRIRIRNTDTFKNKVLSAWLDPDLRLPDLQNVLDRFI